MLLLGVLGYPSLAITLFLHEVYGEERILKALDYFQHPPWQYHHTESCGRQLSGIPLTSGSSLNAALIRPYLLPSRDFYSLGACMPVWGVRPVHCGGEILRLTLYSGYDNYEDAVHFYETVLQRQAEEQKTGFCWFTLHCGTCLSPCHQQSCSFTLLLILMFRFSSLCLRARAVPAAGVETVVAGGQGEAVQLRRAAVQGGRNRPVGSAVAEPLQPHQQHTLADRRPGWQQGSLPSKSSDKSASDHETYGLI